MFGLHVLPAEFPVLFQSGRQKAWLLGKLVSWAAFVNWQHPTDSFVCFHSFSWYALMQFPFCKNPYNLTSHSHRSRETELKSVHQKENKTGWIVEFDLDLCLHGKQMLQISERWFMPWHLTCGLFTEIIWSLCDVVGNTRYASLECPLGRLSRLMRTKSPDQHMCTAKETKHGIIIVLNRSGECLFTWIFSPCSYTYIWEKILVD